MVVNMLSYICFVSSLSFYLEKKAYSIFYKSMEATVGVGGGDKGGMMGPWLQLLKNAFKFKWHYQSRLLGSWIFWLADGISNSNIKHFWKAYFCLVMSLKVDAWCHKNRAGPSLSLRENEEQHLVRNSVNVSNPNTVQKCFI